MANQRTVPWALSPVSYPRRGPPRYIRWAILESHDEWPRNRNDQCHDVWPQIGGPKSGINAGICMRKKEAGASPKAIVVVSIGEIYVRPNKSKQNAMDSNRN